MSEDLEIEFMQHIQSNEGIIYKVIMLYSDIEAEQKDLKQEILYQTWKSFPKFKGDSKFSTWLYRIALNTVLTYKKRIHKKREVHSSLQVHQPVSAQKNEDYEVLYKLIKQLNEVDRMIMTLHMEGYKNPEIAEITGMKQNNLNVRIHRVKGKIINQFKSLHNG